MGVGVCVGLGGWEGGVGVFLVEVVSSFRQDREVQVNPAVVPAFRGLIRGSPPIWQSSYLPKHP